MRIGSIIGLVVGLAAAGCASVAEGPGSASGQGLLTSLQVTQVGDRVGFLLQVTNTSDEPVELVFPSGQRVDFRVTDGGETVWSWSADKSFIQAIQREVLAPGESRSYDGEWDPPDGLSGEFVAAGWLTATGQQAEQSARFRLP